jgi:2-polyprenyl-3-methyl-5-hydroxy-6-metoxy-1,4-benzoquinol methylase
MEDRFFGAGGKWGVVQCANPNCRLVWMNPMPVAEDLGLAYQEYFTHEGGNESQVRRFCMTLYGVATVIPDVLIGLGVAKKRMGAMFLDDLPAGKLLDVGCGDGRFLHAMALRGWQTDGVEVDGQAVAHAEKKYGLKVVRGQLAEAGFPADKFDAITLRHVIEHVPDPVGLLAECRRVLKPGGRLVLATPNLDSQGHAHFKCHWMGLDLPRHLMLFGPISIMACARQAGWEKLEVKTTAANADTFFAVSLSLMNRQRHLMDPTQGPNFLRAIKAIFGQYQEAWRLKTNPDIGEELILVGNK